MKSQHFMNLLFYQVVHELCVFRQMSFLIFMPHLDKPRGSLRPSLSRVIWPFCSLVESRIVLRFRQK